MEEEKKYCHQCRREVKTCIYEEKEVCRNCGTPINQKVEVKSSSEGVGWGIG